MATREELTEQLAVTQKLVAAVDSMARSMARVESSFSAQIGAAEKLTRAMEQLKNTDLSGLNSTKLDAVQKEFKDTEKQTISLTGRLKDLGNWMVKKFPSSAAVGAAAIMGFAQGLDNVLAMGKATTGFLTGLAGSFLDIGASILSIPFNMFTTLVDMAANASAGSNELAEAIRKMRMEFGSLSGPTNKAISENAKTMKGFSETGLSTFQVFGNLAAKLEYMIEVAKSMGAAFSLVNDEFQKNGGALLAYQKGLGISSEELRGFANLAVVSGAKMSDIMKDTTKYTYELGDAFKLDAKLISKDMSKALNDVRHFAGASTKEIAEASVYARKLGLELEKITGTLDAFETFDSAAENAAKLSQSFGVVVDSFKLMEAQNPAEQVDALRKAFTAAGKSAENMSRQELKLLSQTTGLDEATAKMAFSAKNQGLSLDEIKKKSGEAEKKTLTQAQAMQKLADAIERLVQSGGSQTGSFFDMFIKGFLGGVQASKEFREIVMNIKRSLNLVYYEGVKLGKMFVDMFPGVKQFLGGIADFFQPAKFKSLVGGTVDVFKNWMKDLTDPSGKASFSNLMDNLQTKFFSFFDAQSGPGKKMLDGFKTVTRTMSKIVAEGIKWASDKMGDGISFITDLLTGKKKLGDLKGSAGGGLGFIAEILMPMGEALLKAATTLAPKVWELLKTLGEIVVDFVKSDQFRAAIAPAAPYLALAIVGPAVTRAIAASITTSIGKAAIMAFTGGGAKIMEGVAAQASKSASDAASKVASAGGGAAADGFKQVGAANKAASGAINPPGAKDWGVKDAVKLGAKLVAIAAALSIGGVMMATSVSLMRDIMSGAGITKTEDVVPPLLILGAMVVGSVPLMAALKIAASVGSPSDILKGGTVIALATGIVGLAAAGITFMLKKAASPSELGAAGDIMLKMSAVFLSMVPLIFASMAIGALTSGPQALALGAAAIGLGIVGAAVGEMTGISMGIIKKVSEMKIDSSFQMKIDAFIGVMSAIQSFTGTLVSVITLMTPSFTEIITGTASKFSEKVDKSVELMATMIGTRGGKTGIIAVVELVVAKVKELNIGGPRLAKSARVFAEILNAVTNVTRAMTPPPEFFSAQTDFINVLDPAIGKSMHQTMKGYMQVMTANLTEIMVQITSTIRELTTIKIPDVKKIEVISNLIGSMGQIIKALIPSPETLKAFSATSDTTAAWGLIKDKVTIFDAKGASETIGAMGEQFKTLLPILTGDVLTTLVNKAKDIDVGQLEKVKSIADILKITTDLIRSIGDASKGPQISVGNVGANSSFDIINAAPDLKKTMDQMATGLSPLVESMITLVKNVKIEKGFKEQVEVVSRIFSFLGEIPKMAQGLSDVQKGGSVDQGAANSLIESVKSVTIFLGRLVFDGMMSPIGELVNNVKALGAAGVDRAGSSMKKTVDTLTNLFEGVSLLSSAMKVASTTQLDATASMSINSMLDNVNLLITNNVSQIEMLNMNLTDDMLKKVKGASAALIAYGSEIAKITNAIKGEAIGSALMAAADMVKSANELDKALNDGLKIETPVKLSRLAAAVGLGGKFNYTIKNKEVVINMNVSVTMNVDEVEKVMILRKNSIIRDRINLALPEGDPGMIPETRDSPVVVPSGRGQVGP